MHRSGTMFLSRLINALPNTFIIKDGVRIPWVYFRVESNEKFIYPKDCYRKFPIALDFNREVHNIDYLKTIFLEELEALRLPLKQHECWKTEILQFKQGVNYKEFFSRLYDKLSESTGALYVGAKNTNMSQYTEAVLTAFPNLKWIDIIRDPRGWYCSVKVSHPINLLRNMWFWNKDVNNIFSSIVSRRDRHISLTYEELLLSPKKTMQKICDFLGLDIQITDKWIEKLQLTENDGATWYANPSYSKNGERVLGDQNKRKSTDYNTFDPLPLYRWKTKLASWEKIIIRIMAHKNLRRLKEINALPK